MSEMINDEYPLLLNHDLNKTIIELYLENYSQKWFLCCVIMLFCFRVRKSVKFTQMCFLIVWIIASPNIVTYCAALDDSTKYKKHALQFGNDNIRSQNKIWEKIKQML